jgi:hypothetical protein
MNKKKIKLNKDLEMPNIALSKSVDNKAGVLKNYATLLS